MTMSPEEFQQRYADALAAEPTPAPIEHELDLIHRRYRQRRLRLASGAAACIAVVAIVGGSLVALGSSEEDVPSTTVTAEGPDEQQLLARCRTGKLQDPRIARRFFSSGTPVVKAIDVASTRTSVTLESADGKYWAWCRTDSAAPGTNGMDVYLEQGNRGATFFSYGGLGCPGDVDPADCSTFMMRWAERLPPRVAYVDVVMGDGKTVRIEGQDGYFALEYVGNLPPTVKPSRHGGLPYAFQGFVSVKYLDAKGNPIAAQVPENRSLGVPSLGRYPFLGTQPEVMP